MSVIRASSGLACCAVLFLASAASGQEVDYVRELDLVRGPDGRPGWHEYWVSLPLLPDIPDVAKTVIPGNPCVGDPTGPATGDGVINVDDLICHWWTARHAGAAGGTFSVAYIREADCVPVSRTGVMVFGQPRVSGTLLPIDRERGMIIRVTAPAGTTYSLENDARVTGDNDDAWPGRLVQYAPTCTGGQTSGCCGGNARRLDMLVVPHDALVSTADEVLCGLEGVDWSDIDGDGRPDTCWDDADGDRAWDPGEAPTGIFDGQTTISVHDVEQVPGRIPAIVSRHVMYRLGRLFFLGINFPVATGDAVLVETQSGHRPTLWRPATN